MDDEGFPSGDFAIIIYGSLVYKPALKQLFDYDFENRTFRMKLDGYRRVFDLAADRRDVVSNRKAVLNLHQDRGSWCNGLLTVDITPREYGIYAWRETEYRHKLVDHDAVSFYENDPRRLPEEIIVPCDGPTSKEVEPVPSYLKTCLKGARQWGPEFYDDFIATTTLASGKPLAEYLQVEAGKSVEG